MADGGFLAPWLRDLGAAIGLVTGIIAAAKAFLAGRPYSYVEPDNQLDGMIKLYVVNAGQRSIVITSSSVRPNDHWYIAPNASAMTGKGRAHTMYGKTETLPANRQDHNVIIAAGKTHEFFVGPRDRDAQPTWCCIVTSWQPLGGLPIKRPPLFLYKSKSQVERLFLARKGKQDR